MISSPTALGAPQPKSKLPRWFRSYCCLDTRSLALFRIALGLLLLIDLINRAKFLRAHYTDFGVLPRGPLVTEFA
ncbi:MAG: HTTM domain-containing protein, partial [Bdellovibrionota bacterium]